MTPVLRAAEMTLAVRAFAVLAIVLLAACSPETEPAATEPTLAETVVTEPPVAEPTATEATATAATATAATAVDAAERTIETALGEVEVPGAPQRVAALGSGSVDVADRVGITPIAAFENTTEIGAPAMEGIDLVLDRGEPDLEALAAAEPDLILAFSFDGELFPADEATLTEIAPVAAFVFADSGQWKEYLRFWAAALGESERFEEDLAAYETRAAEVCERVQALDEPPEVSIVRLYPDSVGLYVKSGFPGTVVEDACLPRVASQDADDSAEVAGDAESYVIQYLVSLERLEAADGDLMFLWGFENNEEVQEFLETTTASELWQSLDAVQGERVFTVGDHWIGDGLTQAEAMLDDIEAALDAWEER